MARNTVVTAPYATAAAITTSDTVSISSGVADGVYCGVAGTVSLVDLAGNVIATTLAAGTILPLRTVRVNLAGTAATGLVALYY